MVTKHGVVFGKNRNNQHSFWTATWDAIKTQMEKAAMEKNMRDLPHKLGNAENIETCRTLAKTKKMKYFGMQNSVECWAGNSYGKHGAFGEDSYCNIYLRKMYSRSKERMQLDGGNNSGPNAVYRTDEQWYTANKKNKMFRNGTFIGCYWDDVNRAYDDEFEVNKKKQTMTRVDSVDECGKLAEQNKMPYFAVQAGSECRMSKKMFPHYYKYPPTYGNNYCASIKPKKNKQAVGKLCWKRLDECNLLYQTKSLLARCIFGRA